MRRAALLATLVAAVDAAGVRGGACAVCGAGDACCDPSDPCKGPLCPGSVCPGAAPCCDCGATGKTACKCQAPYTPPPPTPAPPIVLYHCDSSTGTCNPVNPPATGHHTLPTCQDACNKPTPAPPGSRFHCDGVGDCAPADSGHGTMAKCVAACPVPPGGIFSQSTCDDAKCTSNCKKNLLPIGECLQMTSGGSAMVESCDETKGVTLKQYSSSTDCTGLGVPNTQPVGQCLQAAAGGYLENTCGKTAGGAGARKLAVAHDRGGVVNTMKA